MTDVYVRARSKVDQKLQQRGIPFEILEYDENNNLVVLDSSVYGIMSPIKEDDIPQSLVDQVESMVVSTVGSTVPTNEMYVRFADVIYKIMYVERIRPTNTEIIYKIYVGS